jgi:hypothetical protein
MFFFFPIVDYLCKQQNRTSGRAVHLETLVGLRSKLE